MNHEAHTTVEQLATVLRQCDPRVLLVPERVLNRVIRFERRLSTLDFRVPHRQNYFTTRERLFDFVTRYEYHVNLERVVTDEVILLPLPDESEANEAGLPRLLARAWRDLYHVRVHLEYRRRIDAGGLDSPRLLSRLSLLGGQAFSEARQVLNADEMLLPPISYQTLWVEFAACFLELWYFAPEQIPTFFPAIEDPASIVAALGDDLDHAGLFAATRPAGAETPARLRSADEPPGVARDRVEGAPDAAAVPSSPVYRRLVQRAGRASTVGNLAKAAVLRQRAVRWAPAASERESRAAAREELRRFAERLCGVLGTSDVGQIDRWVEALRPVLAQADRGFRRGETRLLYDLQKVCTESERGVFAVDLMKWSFTLGQVPLRRPLPLLRDALAARHLNAALLKVPATRLGPADRDRLAALLAAAAEQTRVRLRQRLRPSVMRVLGDEGFRPANLPERAALDKIVDELLDRAVSRGHLSLGNLRDTFSQSNLKLPDLLTVRGLLGGDLLLRIDRRFASELDGVYHRGPVYMRWSHRLSSLAFGTGLGRVISRHVALPFGGAFLVLESIRHLVHFLAPSIEGSHGGVEGGDVGAAQGAGGQGLHSGVVDPVVAPETAAEALPSWNLLILVVTLGVFISLLIESSRFRGWCWRQLSRLGQLLVYLFRDLPDTLVGLPWVRGVLESPWYLTMINYLVKPGVLTAFGLMLVDRVAIWLPQRRIAEVPQVFDVRSSSLWAIVFLCINLFLNSPLGRYTDAVVTDQIRRGWRELQIRVFAAIVRFVADAFRWMLKTLEQLIYSVDEMLRFRAGERWWTLGAKAVAGSVWSVISYVVRIYTTLLIEPQINPIKHFPVVTVAHKMILPFSYQLTSLFAAPLKPLLGGLLANTIAVTTVFLSPGVFGFLAWELKENWRLYEANRRRDLRPIPIGSHGESMARLLRPGFHSGTLARIFGRMRRGARREALTGEWRGLRRQLAALHHVQDAVAQFIDREWFGLLRQLPQWPDVETQIAVRVATSEVRIETLCRGLSDQPCTLVIHDQGGWLVARTESAGWMDALQERQRHAVRWALTGVYKVAGIELLWEELTAGLEIQPVFYEMNRDGLLAWVDDHLLAGHQFKLRDRGATAGLNPQPKFVTEPRLMTLPDLVFAARPISWRQWISSWDQIAAAHQVERPPLRAAGETAEDKAAG